MSFEGYGFSESILTAIKELGWSEPTDVQIKSFDPVLSGNDVIVQSKTGSGKTGAFGLPLIEILKDDGEGLRALIMLPTRELAKQVFEDMQSFAKYTGLKFALVYGGVDMNPQIGAIREADVLIGTPGRILDHLRQNTLDMSGIQFLVLDEADRMLDMGFIDDVKTIIKQIPNDHITMLFSATMPAQIQEIGEQMMYKPVHVKCESFVDDTLLSQYYIEVPNRFKLDTLKELIRREKPDLSIVFCATRGLTDAVASYLQGEEIEAHAIHGGHTQAKREKVLAGFHAGKVHVLIATDVAARGLDIDDVTHIFNYNVPRTDKEYVHRMGRTARAGKQGKVITLLSHDEYEDFGRIDSLFSGKIEKMELEDYRPQVANLPRRDEIREKPEGRIHGQHRTGGSRGHAGPRHSSGSRSGARNGPRTHARPRHHHGTKN